MKIWLKNLTGVPPQEILLIFAGRELEDRCTLADYMSTIFMARRLRC
jgi:hypothetical protein